VVRVSYGRTGPGFVTHYSALVFKALERSDPVFGGVAAWVALCLIIATLVLVAPEDRSRAKGSVWLLAWHLLFTLVLALIPPRHAAETSVRLIALSLVLASIARSVFLLFVHSFWMRRFARPLPTILRDVIQGFIFVIASLLILRSAGVQPGSLLATSALLTAVIGLSLQDTLGNLFAGLAIQAQRPFAVGDWVQLDGHSPPGSIGQVIEINWRATRVLTLDQLEITIPNGTMAKSSIVNFSRPTDVVRREAEVHAPYDVSPEFVRKTLLASLDHVHSVLQKPPPQVITRSFSERGITYALRYFIDRFHDREFIDSAVRERVWYAMARANLAMPVPRRRIEMVQEATAQSGNQAEHDSVKDLLKQVSLFKQLPEDSAQHLAARCRRKRYAPGEVIVHQGDTSTEMYVIESGRVRIELPADDGRALVVAELGRGEFLGEMSLMTGESRTADVIACEETLLVVIDREALAPLLRQHPGLEEQLSQALAERQRRLDELRQEDIEEPRISIHDEVEILSRIRRFFSR